jgi:hypothetical protein
MVIFERPADSEAFEHVLEEAVQRIPVRLLAYHIIPDHWQWWSGRGKTANCHDSLAG